MRLQGLHPSITTSVPSKISHAKIPKARLWDGDWQQIITAWDMKNYHFKVWFLSLLTGRWMPWRIHLTFRPRVVVWSSYELIILKLQSFKKSWTLWMWKELQLFPWNLRRLRVWKLFWIALKAKSRFEAVKRRLDLVRAEKKKKNAKGLEVWLFLHSAHEFLLDVLMQIMHKIAHDIVRWGEYDQHSSSG